MSYIRIAKASWDGGLEKARKAYELIGPVPEKDSHKYAVLAAGQLPDMGFKSTKLSPKWVVFPQSEVMFEYTLDESKANHHILQEVPAAPGARAVIGIRPYDAKAIQLTKMNFDNKDYKDPFWLRNYERCTFVGLAINEPSSTDFSTSCGTGPFAEEGLDVLLVDAGDAFIAKVLTDKGKKFLSEAGFAEEAGADAAKAVEDLKAKAEAAITSKVSYNKIAGKTIMDLYDAPFWKDVLFGCINCGTCTYACPTCWCFDIQDEVKGTDGVRVRNWDSCMTGLFTHHASGHNPREHEWERTRQRFMHKLKYFVDKYDAGLMCVGCGRCVEQCPANIDIRTVCNTLNDF
ncbi:4Fe-4S dicluster domain-containing protein [Desulfobotulus sp. H1]|uniref:4Fe-4S dicluster domain-containing protein n=1 Tax=Desulfobotulus pelophilus TaxID=2823377 RepID=A0ABT3N564_9BACT|nr:4Fe-4S dicluster domain-containing protein [Desulfobotulus pelophilus]MCW7752579.1 4Fe-4S dicluster domain-containing protein [Desulfobotulus pelophilus]MCW7752593.1 4Fe-4S dicluster domain-containing protein [Desulfobotulus pelophilus]